MTQASESFAATMLRSLEGKELTCAYDIFNRGNWFAEVGRHEEAIADYDRANELEPDYEGGMAWYNRGNSLYLLGRVEEALASYRRPIEIGSTEWGPYSNVAGLLGRQERYDEELAVYDAYLAACASEGIEIIGGRRGVSRRGRARRAPPHHAPTASVRGAAAGRVRGGPAHDLRRLGHRGLVARARGTASRGRGPRPRERGLARSPHGRGRVVPGARLRGAPHLAPRPRRLGRAPQRPRL
ncbi:MAG: tetratricopeptide repeat protein, partial [Myxococcales bacterium]|nr:tetratricopeptide repeat protein [Myxococcales bacterium]